MQKTCLVVGACALLGTLAAEAKMPGLRMVQLDLARQTETCSFISNYVDRVSALGYDTLVLYLEARVATKTFSLPAGERYTADEMRGIVAHAAEKGLTAVPVVSLLGHAEQFFSHPGCEQYMEQGGDNIRGGSPTNTMTFCLSNPATRKFLSDYVADLCEIFPAPYFHVGFDEAWNSGTCPVCHRKELEDECFTEAILFAHGLLKRHGKRMWMWDDFFGFHPKALARTPKDVVMFHWNYDTDISDRGDRFNFSGRFREDSLAKFVSLGYEVVPCAFYYPGNVRSFVNYARHHRVYGYLQTQWENTPHFQGVNLPHVVAAALALDDPARANAEDPYARAADMLFPSLQPLERAALVRLLENWSDELALDVLRSSACARTLGEVVPDQLCEKALLDDILCRAELRVLSGRYGRAEAMAYDLRRSEADLKAVRELLAPVPSAARRLAARRAAQAAAWRPECHPAEAPKECAEFAEKAEKLLSGLSPASADEKVVELELTLVDRYGAPRWTVEGCFAGEWRELASGAWKPAPGVATYVSRQRFTSETMPEALRIGYSGYGSAMLRYVSVCGRDARVVPAAVTGTTGLVRNARAVLRDDYDAVEFGETDFLPAYYDRRRMKFRSTLTVGLEPESKQWK